MLKTEEEKYFRYFNRSVLNHYKANSHIYEVNEDDIGGEIRVNKDWSQQIEEQYPYLELRFAFRKLKDNTTCIAMFMPSFVDKVPEFEIHKWVGFHIKNPIFKEDDVNFQRWVDMYIHGSWEIESGPKIQIEKLIPLISSLTSHAIGTPLFKYDKNVLLNYPSAENIEEYTKAVLELYRLVIDGMQKDAIVKLAHYLKKPLTDEDKRLNCLKEIVPGDKRKIIHNPLSQLSRKRMSIHGVPTEGINKLDAFAKFDRDLHDIEECLRNLLIWLEESFKIDAESCKERDEALTLFPYLIGPPRPEFKYSELLRCVGKTVKSIEFGEEQEHEKLHKREAIVLHFTDGSSMSISIGSNAMNLYLEHKIRPTEFHTDLMVFWADPIKPKD